MKNVNIFGLKLSFEIKRNKYSDENIYSSDYSLREKIIYLILIMAIVSFSAKFTLLSSQNNYKIGDIVKKDIYAPTTIIFKDDFAKEKIIEDMIVSAGKEYIYSADVKELYIDYLDNFFEIFINKKNTNLENSIDTLEKKLNKKISNYVLSELMRKNISQVKTLHRQTKNFLNNAYDSGIVSEKNRFIFKEEINKSYEKLSTLEKNIVDIFIAPNYVLDENKTKKNIEEKVSQIQDQYVEIKAGTLIGKKGEVLNERRLKLLESCGVYSYKKSIAIIFATGIYLFIVSTIFYNILFTKHRKEILNKNYYRSSLIIIGVIISLFRVLNNDYMYLIPIDTAFFLLIILINRSYAMSLFSFMLFYMLPILNFDLKFYIIYSLTLGFGAYIVSKVNTRSGLVALGIELSILKVITLFIISFLTEVESFRMFINTGFTMVSGAFSGMLTIAFLPYFERTFNILTIFRLLELGDLSHPLLKRISVEAPGTFQHSIMVATLSENAATAIGANPIFCRVASYYHDLGKIKRPTYYVENQINGENPHKEITPFLSSLIIISHTKDGAELAKEYQIPKEIRDVMYEHQGTTFLAYFYNEAKKNDPNVDKEQFRYGGPKPKTKESAIIMLADSIEAGVRSLDEKTPMAMENMIRKIIGSKIEDNQLSEADLTFKEIEIIIKTFVKTLMSIHHVRIKYPDQKK